MADACARALESQLASLPYLLPYSPTVPDRDVEGSSKGEHVGLAYYIVCGKAEEISSQTSRPPFNPIL
jgi:hypothetical protein